MSLAVWLARSHFLKSSQLVSLVSLISVYLQYAISPPFLLYNCLSIVACSFDFCSNLSLCWMLLLSPAQSKSVFCPTHPPASFRRVEEVPPMSLLHSSFPSVIFFPQPVIPCLSPASRTSPLIRHLQHADT